MFELIMENSVILTALGALTSAIGYLWRANLNNHKGTLVKLEECEKRDEKNQGAMLTLTEKVGRLEGRQEGVEALSRSVLREIADARQ